MSEFQNPLDGTTDQLGEQLPDGVQPVEEQSEFSTESSQPAEQPYGDEAQQQEYVDEQEQQYGEQPTGASAEQPSEQPAEASYEQEQAESSQFLSRS